MISWKGPNRSEETSQEVLVFVKDKGVGFWDSQGGSSRNGHRQVVGDMFCRKSEQYLLMTLRWRM